MFHYEYVTKKEAEPYRTQFLEIIHEVQDLVRDKFTFSYQFIGSSSRNMITCDWTTNKGFDFDVNIRVNDEDEEYSAEDIKKALMRAIDQVARPLSFSPCEDSTRVITLKMKNIFRSRIEYSCDFAIVYDYENNGEQCQQYIHFNKQQRSYTWEEQPHGYHLEKKVKWLKDHSLWDEVLELYLWKKNTNTNPDKKSRALYAETIHEICQQNGYYSKH